MNYDAGFYLLILPSSQRSLYTALIKGRVCYYIVNDLCRMPEVTALLRDGG